MKRVPLSARVLADVDNVVRARAESEGVSLSAIVERALTSYLSQGASVDNQPASASELEKLANRVSQLEVRQSSQQGRR